MSLKLQILGAFAYVLLLIIVALEVPLALNLSRRIDAEVKNEAAAQAFLVAAGASGRMADRAELGKVVRRAGQQLGARVIVVGANGPLLADSTVVNPSRTSYGSRPEIGEALAGGRSQGERHSNTLGQDLLYTAVPVTNNGQVVGAARVTQSLEAVHSRVRRGVLALVAIGAFALVVGLALAWFLASSLSRPLRNLATTARRFEAGELGARAEVSGAAEQREVSAAFNDRPSGSGRSGRPARVRRERLAPAPHATDGTAPAARVRALEGEPRRSGRARGRGARGRAARAALDLAPDPRARGRQARCRASRLRRRRGRARARALGRDRGAGRPRARARRQRRRDDRCFRRGPGDPARQPDRERAALLPHARRRRLGP